MGVRMSGGKAGSVPLDGPCAISTLRPARGGALPIFCLYWGVNPQPRGFHIQTGTRCRTPKITGNEAPVLDPWEMA